MTEPRHLTSDADLHFRAQFETCEVLPAQFDHRSHVRLAYIYLCEAEIDEACDRMKRALLRFLAHHGVPATKYHETLTRAWVMAVRHFMSRATPTESADALIAQSPALLDPKVMLTHYAASTLFSDEARRAFVAPDLDPIPQGKKDD